MAKKHDGHRVDIWVIGELRLDLLQNVDRQARRLKLERLAGAAEAFVYSGRQVQADLRPALVFRRQQAPGLPGETDHLVDLVMPAVVTIYPAPAGVRQERDQARPAGI